MSHLASRLKEQTMFFKNNEKEHFTKVKEFNGDDEFSLSSKQKTRLDDNFFLDEQQKQEHELRPKYQDEEITNLVKSINDLAGIFKDLSVLVVEQGTILDRIDYNVESAKESTEQAVEILDKLHQSEKSPRALACIKCQVTTITVLVIVIAIKFFG